MPRADIVRQMLVKTLTIRVARAGTHRYWPPSRKACFHFRKSQTWLIPAHALVVAKVVLLPFLLSAQKGGHETHGLRSEIEICSSSIIRRGGEGTVLNLAHLAHPVFSQSTFRSKKYNTQCRCHPLPLPSNTGLGSPHPANQPTTHLLTV